MQESTLYLVSVRYRYWYHPYNVSLKFCIFLSILTINRTKLQVCSYLRTCKYINILEKWIILGKKLIIQSSIEVRTYVRTFVSMKFPYTSSNLKDTGTVPVLYRSWFFWNDAGNTIHFSLMQPVCCVKILSLCGNSSTTNVLLVVQLNKKSKKLQKFERNLAINKIGLSLYLSTHYYKVYVLVNI